MENLLDKSDTIKDTQDIESDNANENSEELFCEYSGLPSPKAYEE
jgi:hypothetical protein